MMTLFDYQSHIMQELATSYKAGKRKQLIVLPTGGGKTVIFCHLCKSSLEKLGGFTTILVHRRELAEQTYSTLKKLSLNPALVTAKGTEVANSVGEFERLSTGLATGFDVYIGMVETIYKRVQKGLASYKALLEQSNFLIVDEFHFTNFVKVLQLIPPEKPVFGFTATPLYATKKHKISHYHDQLIIGAQPSDLIERERLVAPEYYIHEVDESGFKLRAGEFSDESVIKAYEEQSIMESVLANYHKWQAGEKTVCFCSNIKYARAVNDFLLTKGINSKVIASDDCTEQERQSIFDWLRSTSDAFLINVGIATTGTDIPDLQSIILLRATTSMTLYIQMTGRGARVAHGKTKFKVFDYGNNRERHGYWEERRDWQALIKAAERPKRKKKVDDLGLEVMTIPALDQSEGKKGLVILQPDGSPAPQWNYLQDLKWQDMTMQELEVWRKIKGYKVGWLHRQIWNKHGERGLEEYASLKGYSSGWVWNMKQRLA